MTDNDPIALKDAAEMFKLTVCTLRAEADRGRLTIYRIGKKDYTTLNDIREMVAKCRVEKKGHGFTLTRSESNSSSETDRASSARAAARETALMLRRPSPNISDASTSRNRRAHR